MPFRKFSLMNYGPLPNWLKKKRCVHGVNNVNESLLVKLFWYLLKDKERKFGIKQNI